MARRAKLPTVQELAFKVADDAARQTIYSFSAPGSGDWWDTRAAEGDAKGWIEEAVHYLAMRGRLKRHPRDPARVRFLRPPVDG